MPDRLPILIAGGGIGGLAAALALADVGQSVQVLERASGASEAGAGIQLGPNAVKVLRRLGVGDAVGAVASVPEALVVHAGRSGAVLAQLRLGATIEQRHGAPYWVVHRADLQRVLMAAATSRDGIAIDGAREVLAVAATGAAGVLASCADGTSVPGRALIGADGLWSRARAVVAPGVRPEASGFCAFRALIPQSDAGALARPVVGAWLSPRAHVVHYPVRGGREINVVVIVRGPWTSQSWDTPASADEVGAAIADFAPELRQALAAASVWHQWSLAKPLHLSAWSRGSVVLLGDAAHALLPFFAQGGAMALEDAAVLADCVAQADAGLPAAFQRYEAQRYARVARVQAASARNGQIFHLSGPAAAARDAVLRTTPQILFQARFDWLFGGVMDADADAKA